MIRRRLALLLLVALAAVLVRRRQTAADLLALDDPAFAAHLRQTGMAQQVEAAMGRLDEPGGGFDR